MTDEILKIDNEKIQRPIIYDKNCKGSVSYIKLAKEILKNLTKKHKNETI